MDVIAASIPLFFGLIGVELAVARVRGRRVYGLSDSISDLSLGILSQLTGLFITLLTYALFAWVSGNLAIQRFLPVPAWPTGAPLTSAAAFASWAGVFLLVDLCYYWSHRLSHRVHILWAGHVVHHSSEEYNLTVALRQSSLHGLFTWAFYMPLALLGVPWVMFAVCHGLNLIYQFWIHTREVGRLGPLEWFMNTPSHHRVHHGINPRYQDRNHAGVFIIWDRLFGTFIPEDEEPVYGITTPLASWNPLWANVHVFVDIARQAAYTAHWRDKLGVIFGPPDWRPADLGGPVTIPEVSPATFEKYDPPVSRAVKWYAFVQFVAVLAGTLVALKAAETLPGWQLAAIVFYVALSLSNLGSLLESAPWVRPIETARLVTMIAASAALLFLAPRFNPTVVLAIGVFGILSLGCFAGLRRRGVAA